MITPELILWTGGAAGDIYRLIPLIIIFIFFYLFAKLGLGVFDLA